MGKSFFHVCYLNIKCRWLAKHDNPTKAEIRVRERKIMIPIGFMFLQCSEGAEDVILGQIKSISGVAYAYKLEGSYDIVVKIQSDRVEQFTHAIALIRKVPNILNTDTIVGFK